MRILHAGNIANNAYRNAKLLNEHGDTHHVIHYDFYHFASQPEWYELGEQGVDRARLGDDYFPNFWAIEGGDALCPRWCAFGLQHMVIAYLRLLNLGSPAADTAWDCLQYARLKAALRRDTIPQRHALDEAVFEEAVRDLPMTPDTLAGMRRARRFDDLLTTFRRLFAAQYGEERAAGMMPPFDPAYIDGFLSADPAFRAEITALRAEGLTYASGFELDPTVLKPFKAPAAARPEDAAIYASAAPWWDSLFEQYDVLILYGQTPPLGWFTGRRYLAYEHGTIRSLPFEDSWMGRVLRESYLAAEGVFITNIDWITAANRLEIEPERRLYIPHGFDERPLFDFAQATGPVMGADPVVFFGAARQDWIADNPEHSKGNDRMIRAAKILRDEGIGGFRLRFVDWGVDADASKALIHDLGLDDCVDWIEPVPRRELWMEYMKANAVLDQFLVPAIGGVCFEAVALGARVITYANDEACVVAFGERMPLLSAHTAETVAERMRQVIADPLDTAGLGRAGVEWTRQRHSGARIRDVMDQGFQRLERARASDAAELANAEREVEPVAGAVQRRPAAALEANLHDLETAPPMSPLQRLWRKLAGRS